MIKGITSLVLLVGLTGCMSSLPPKDTIPSPTQVISEGNYQLRFHRTAGEGATSVQSGILARPYVSAGSGQEGAANGCTVTSLGTPPERLEAHLKLAGCGTVDLHKE